MTAASNSEARKRTQAAQEAAGATNDGAVDSGAIGRLNEAQVADLAQHLYDREGFHAADSWATETEINRSRYEALAEAVRDWLPSIVREHTDRALAEVEQRLVDRWEVGTRTGDYNGGLTGAIGIVRHYRAARQERDPR